MRRLRRLATAAAVILAILATTAAPAIAADDEFNTTTGGFVGDNLIGARAGAFGGRAGPVYSCDWERVWPENTGVLGSFLATIGRVLSTFSPFEGTFSGYDPDEIRVIDSDRAQEIRDEADKAAGRGRSHGQAQRPGPGEHQPDRGLISWGSRPGRGGAQPPRQRSMGAASMPRCSMARTTEWVTRSSIVSGWL